MNNMQIVCQNYQSPMVRYAVEELQRYTRTLFGLHPEVVTKPTAPCVAIGDGGEFPALGEQDYLVRRTLRDGQDCVVCAGGSARATLWAVYQLVEAWGVHYMVQGDVMPEEAGPLRLPEVDAVFRPVMKRRGFRIINEMMNSGVLWSLADHKTLFAQLAKMRFNGVLVAAYPFHPWCHWGFRDVQRSKVGLCYGFRHPVHSDTIGRELFGGVAEHTNPDFQGLRTYEDWIAAGHRFMSGLIEAAHARGLDVALMQHMTELPLEVMRHLPRWSEEEGVHLPKEAISQPVHARFGFTVLGGDPALDVYRSPLNPVFVEMVESWLQAHIEAYPNCECYGLMQPEFPPGGAGTRECWQELDVRHDIEKHFPLAALEDKARNTKVTSLMSQERMVTELHGAIQTLRWYDILLNERKVMEKSSSASARFMGHFISEYAQALVPVVMGESNFELLSIIDYLPAHVSDRMDTLSFVPESKIPVSMITTIEDDNVGFFPQMNTQALHRIMAGIRRHGLEGFWFRQFDISEHEPCMYYMARAAWDEHTTPETAYSEFADRVCGSKVATELVEVFHGIEALLSESNALVGAGFMMPRLYISFWEESFGEDRRERLLRYVELVRSILARMEEVATNSAPRGRRWAERYREFLCFATEYPLVAAKIVEARLVFNELEGLKARREIEGYDRAVTDTASLLEQALRLSEQALRTWSRLVVDPTDLGTLAGLNAYGHDYLRGLAWEMYLKSQAYSL